MDVNFARHRTASMVRWLRSTCWAALAMLVFAATAGPVITFHPHVPTHDAEAHHAGPVAPKQFNIASVIEALCLTVDGCHQLGTWLDLFHPKPTAVAESGSAFPVDDARFASTLLPGLLRPPNSLTGQSGDEWVAASLRDAVPASFAHRS